MQEYFLLLVNAFDATVKHFGSEMDTDSCDEFGPGDGFGEVVIGTNFESIGKVGNLLAGR